MDYSRAIDRLISRQMRDWDLAGANYEALAGVSMRRLQLGESSVVLQFNPERRRSSAARLDKLSLAQRRCFLCTENQPAKQKALLWGEHYKIQVNPYPIFKRHLTIADLRHVPQRLAERVGDMLSLARSLPEFVVFYNGPRCGASAPDHAHFQGFIGFVDSLGRSLFTIETSTRRAAVRYALRLLDLLPVTGDDVEPMVNVLCWWNTTTRLWHLVIFPRRKHRPACYGEGEGRLLLSPGAVDMGGLWAIPEPKDYDILTPEMIQALYDELCMTRQDLSPVITGFSQHWEDLQPI